MGQLEDDFPELKNAARSKRVQVFRIGEEPPEWVEWADKTVVERIRGGEILRRIIHGNYESARRVPRTAQITRR